MKKSIHQHFNKCYLLTGFIFILISSSFGQVYKKQPDTGGIRKAIYYISKNQTEKAKIECRKILQKNPKRADANVLLARLYSWENKFDTARTILAGVLQNQPDNKEALNALTNVELWSNHYDKALSYANRGLAAYPNSEDFLIKKAKVYVKLGNYTEASAIINKTLQINPNNKEAMRVHELLKNKSLLNSPKNGVGIFYQNDQFDKSYTPWNSVSAYFYSVRKWGVISAGINYANRFKINGLQYELNIFPRISHSMRAYVGGGYSKDYIFPNYKFGASLYQKFLKIAELEVGARYLKFKNLPAIIIYTGGVSVRYQHWRGTINTYITPQASTINQSYQVSAQYSFKNPNERIVLALSTGLSPRNYLDTLNNKGYVFPKNSNRAELRYQRPLFSNKTLIKASVGYEKNDYFSGVKRARISAGMGIELLF